MTERSPLPPINFKALADALLSMSESIVPDWLKGGKRSNQGHGHEWICGSIRGGEGKSCSVNLKTGRWADFHTQDKGPDLVSLYAAIEGLSMGKAAVECARKYGLEDVAGVQRDPNYVAPARPPAPPPKPKPKVEEEGWKTVRPVPVGTPEAKFNHYHRNEQDIEHVAEYRHGTELQGYVVRFRTSDGGKDTLPRTWCVSARSGTAKWHWRQFDVPRPLYFPAHELPAGRTVVLVEGEKKGDALQQLLDATRPGVYCVASWPGGCKAWDKADWSPLAGSHVLLWPDCDAKREKLTPTERKDNPDPAAQAVLQQAKPLLPPEKQPGTEAMLRIGHQLADAHGCTVQWLPIPKPGEVDDGWDCGDAINRDGWDGERVLAFFAQAHGLPPLPADKGKVSADDHPGPQAGGGGGAGSAPPPARDPLAEAGDQEDAFQAHIDFLCEQAKCKPWELGVNRKMVITALRKAPALADCLGFSELTNAPTTMVPWPWRPKAGPLTDSDDLRLGDWLCSTYKIKPASRAALAEAIDTVADARRFHPIRDWLRSLEWDEKPRLGKWLMHVLQIDPATLSERQRRYLELIGRYILMGHVARVMQPGCKFDYSPVLEGVAGVGKSTLVKVLVGEEYFSDTHFDIGNGKDGMEQLEGLWAYELAELTALRRADSEQVKQFFSSTVDRFRGAYGRFVQPHPRQCVIWCTTNKRQYLYDLTGNRRFWPVWVSKPVRTDWLRKWRGQLFAEALTLFQAGEPYYPTREEEVEFFYPEQEKRLVETSVQARLYELLTREGSSQGEGRASSELNSLTSFVTLPMLVRALGSDEAKSTSLLEGQIRGWLESQGWESCRESTGQRRRGYRQPREWPPKPDEGDEVPAKAPEEGPAEPARAAGWDGGEDDAPF